MVTVQELTKLADLTEHRLLWRTLLSQTPRGSFFQTREWLEHHLHQQGPAVRLRTLVVSIGTQPIGILPFVIRPVTTRLGQVRALMFPWSSGAGIAGPIGRDRTATLWGGLKHLADAPRDWDIIDLRGVDQHLDHGRTANAFRLANLNIVRRSAEEAAAVCLADLDAGQVFVQRRQLQSAEREMWKLGRWEHIVATPEDLASRSVFDAVWSMIDDLPAAEQLRSLHETAWVAAEAQALRIQALRLHGRTHGCLLTVMGQDRVDVLFATAGTEAAERVLVGRLLFDDVLNRAPEVYFGADHAHLAAAWDPSPRHQTRLTHFSFSQPKAQLLRFARLLRVAN
jgi:hypothetical protein